MKNKLKKKELLGHLKKYPDFAEFMGIMMGDGSICLDKKGKYHTVISFNKQEKDYLHYVNKLFTNLFHPYQIYTYELEHELQLKNVSITVGEILIKYGLLYGDKVKNEIVVPNWIAIDKLYIGRFLRGFFDTDGSVFRKYGNYAQIQIKLGCKKTLKSIHYLFHNLCFNPTRIQMEHNKDGLSWKFYLSRQDEIMAFFQEIEPKNIKHLKRYKKIKSGVAGTSKVKGRSLITF